MDVLPSAADAAAALRENPTVYGVIMLNCEDLQRASGGLLAAIDCLSISGIDLNMYTVVLYNAASSISSSNLAVTTSSSLKTAAVAKTRDLFDIHSLGASTSNDTKAGVIASVVKEEDRIKDIKDIDMNIDIGALKAAGICAVMNEPYSTASLSVSATLYTDISKSFNFFLYTYL